MGKQALFIINPTAGNLDDNPEMIENIIQGATDFSVKKWNTTGDGDEQKIEQLLKEQNYDLIIVGGGDGTIKMVASQMEGLKIPILPIPFGSANGLCSCLGIQTWQDSLRALQVGKLIQMDVLNVNGEVCLHVCDFGFNAGLIEKFEESDERGMSSYFKSSVAQIFENNKFIFNLTLGEEKIKVNAKMLVIANGDRYGIGAMINPNGKMNDGKFEIIVLNPDSFKEWMALTAGFFREDFSDLNFVQTFVAKNVIVENLNNAPFHIDGELEEMQERIEIKINEDKMGFYTNF